MTFVEVLPTDIHLDLYVFFIRCLSEYASGH